MALFGQKVRRASREVHRRVVALALVAVSAQACDACRRSPPPVLFRGAEAGAGLATPQLPVGPDPDPDPGPPSDAAVAPANELLSSPVAGDGTSLALDGVTVSAPAGERFAQYLPLDVDGDGDRDVAVVRATRGGDGAPLGVGFYRREPAGLVGGAVASSDPAVPPEVVCASGVLRSTSSRTVTVTYRCGARGPDGALTDAGVTAPGVAAVHVVVALQPAPTVRYRVQELTPVPSGTPLETSVAALDRDGDGRDDVVVTVGARRPQDRPERVARAQVVLLDRGAGYARDTSEPEASFARLAREARDRASPRRAADAIAAVERVVRLRRALCAESGAPRVRLGNDAGVACAGSAGLRAAAEALARAYIAGGELPAAIALTRPDTASELGLVPVERVAGDVRRAMLAPDGGGINARSGPFVGQPLDAATMARASALSLVPASAPTTVNLRGPLAASVELSTLAVTRNEPGTVGESLARSLDGARTLQGFYETCDGVVAAVCPSSALECVGAPPVATEAPPGAELVRITDLPSAEHSARCVRDAAGTPQLVRALDMRALGFGREGLVVVHRGRLYRAGTAQRAGTAITAGMPLGGPFPPGSSASESGEYAAVATAEGVFVRDSAGRWAGWAPRPLAGRFRQLTDLAISNDGRVLVALLGAQLWVLDRGASATP